MLFELILHNLAGGAGVRHGCVRHWLCQLSDFSFEGGSLPYPTLIIGSPYLGYCRHKLFGQFRPNVYPLQQFGIVLVNNVSGKSSATFSADISLIGSLLLICAGGTSDLAYGPAFATRKQLCQRIRWVEMLLVHPGLFALEVCENPDVLGFGNHFLMHAVTGGQVFDLNLSHIEGVFKHDFEMCTVEFFASWGFIASGVQQCQSLLGRLLAAGYRFECLFQ
ncbi:MAG TPA: hypothetical protein VD735_02335 [Candidatus Saccharimonadales bacterium]|nr:hypothetical protein [Candidatus Saccharimonadales bacterium]